MPGLCVFNDAWIEKEDYKLWLTKDPRNDKRKGFCCACKSTIDVSRMGEGAIKSHNKGAKHIKNVLKVRGVVPITLYAANSPTSQQPAKPSTASSSSSNPSSSLDNVPQQTPNNGDMQSFVTSTSVLRAEIIWAMKCVDSHFSMNANAGLGDIFSAMFPDSAIARGYSCADKKTAYLCTFGLAPYFKEQLSKAVKSAENYVLLFDETLNKELQEKQMDIHIRFWSKDTVVTRFLESKFLGHASAEHLFDDLCPLVASLGHRSLIQLSMDGPNVNLKLRNLLANDIEKNTPCKLIDVGTCGLHVVHNSFRAGCTATSWEIETLLTAVYNLFRDSPARREDLRVVAEATTVPLKYCRHRWLENAEPAQRVIDLLPNLVAFASAAKNKSITEPVCKSFLDLIRLLGDPLLKSKLEFFVSVARELEPFLALYQTDRPLLPFLAEDMGSLIKSLLKRIVNDSIIEGATSLSVVRIDWEANLKDPSKVDVGFAAKRSMLSKEASDRQRFKFRMDCQVFIKALVKKLLDKAPIKYALVRNLSWLNPCKIVSAVPKDRTHAGTQLENALHILVDAKRVREEKCDIIRRQYVKLCETVVLNESASEAFRSFNYKMDRLDELFYGELHQKEEFRELWAVIQMLLLLSHSQAAVERGFSVHKQTTVENLSKQSLVGRRLIYQAVRSAGGPLSVPVTKDLLCSASGARRKYEEYLEQQRKEDEKKKMAKKRKAFDEEVEALKTKSKQLRLDIASLDESANSKAEAAEKLGKLALISESNALRRRAQEKAAQLKENEKLVEEKVSLSSSIS